MEDYRKIAEKAVKGKKELMPIHNGTIDEYKSRLIVFREVIEEVDVILKDLGNRYIEENRCNSEQTEQIREINKTIISSLIKHFTSNK